MMEITGVRFDFSFESRPGIGELVAFASLEFDKELIVRRVRIVSYPDSRVHIFMPSRLVNEKFEDIAFASTKGLKTKLYTTILERLSKELRGRGDMDKDAIVQKALASAETLASGMCG